MHGGLPLIGVSVLVYGTVGVAAIAHHALRRVLARSGAGPRGLGARGRAGAWAAASP